MAPPLCVKATWSGKPANLAVHTRKQRPSPTAPTTVSGILNPCFWRSCKHLRKDLCDHFKMGEFLKHHRNYTGS